MTRNTMTAFLTHPLFFAFVSIKNPSSPPLRAVICLRSAQPLTEPEFAMPSTR